MTDPIRALLRELLDYAVMCGGLLKSEGLWDEGDDCSHDLLERVRAALAAQPATTPSLAELVNPQPGYQPGTGNEDGAQLVGGDWWAPEFGCDSLEATLDAIRDRIAPYLREPVAGVDVPGPDGDYGDVLDLCAAEGVDPQVGVPLLQRARKAWEVGATPTPPADGEAGPSEEEWDAQQTIGHQGERFMWDSHAEVLQAAYVEWFKANQAIAPSPTAARTAALFTLAVLLGEVEP